MNTDDTIKAIKTPVKYQIDDDGNMLSFLLDGDYDELATITAPFSVRQAIATAINEHEHLASELRRLTEENGRIKSAHAVLLEAVEDFGEEDCCLTLYPQQFNDGRCRHCIAQSAITKNSEILGTSVDTKTS